MQGGKRKDVAVLKALKVASDFAGVQAI